MTAAVRIGILGCGMVADEYAGTLAASAGVALAACSDQDPDRADAFAARHGLLALTADQLCDPREVDVVAVLTPPRTHASLAGLAMDARVPAVWIEKPLAEDPAAAYALLEQAQRADVLVGAAPDTVLGTPTRTAAAALADGLIGELTSVQAALHSTGPERWHPAPEPFYAQGAGPLGDMGPYYLAALVALLGPVISVDGAHSARREGRTIASGPHAGSRFTAHAPTHVTALLTLDGAVPCVFTASFDTAASDTPHIEIHGTEGTLLLPDPNFHVGDVAFRRRGELNWSTLPPADPSLFPAGRGMGVADLARALTEGRPPRCPAARAAHIVQVHDAILASASLTACHIPSPATGSGFADRSLAAAGP